MSFDATSLVSDFLSSFLVSAAFPSSAADVVAADPVEPVVPLEELLLVLPVLEGGDATNAGGEPGFTLLVAALIMLTVELIICDTGFTGSFAFGGESTWHSAEFGAMVQMSAEGGGDVVESLLVTVLLCATTEPPELIMILPLP
ncbi:hypothetical protein, partial [Herminiimonas fonticola]|uniref:hypothetical protein n=1 Tax=Herminiimonas fonticola TaxID=303380 RepID=UPI003341B907